MTYLQASSYLPGVCTNNSTFSWPIPPLVATLQVYVPLSLVARSFIVRFPLETPSPLISYFPELLVIAPPHLGTHWYLATMIPFWVHFKLSNVRGEDSGEYVHTRVIFSPAAWSPRRFIDTDTDSECAESKTKLLWYLFLLSYNYASLTYENRTTNCFVYMYL